jgi:uncharacterized delta-60 repeat protein
VTTAIGDNSDDRAYALALLSDGRILVAGRSTASQIGCIALVCYNRDGSLDTRFGDGGIVTTRAPHGSFARAAGMSMHPDGKIVVAGSTGNGQDLLTDNTCDFLLARYDANGVLDPTFGSAGIVTTDFDGSAGIAFSVAIQSNGKIVAAGGTRDGQWCRFAIVRYHSNGNLDDGFGTHGKVAATFLGTALRAHKVLVQPDGKILIAGCSYDGSKGDFALARYLPDGTRDSSFGLHGVETIAFAGDASDAAWDMALQPDGKIVLAGRTGGGIGVDDFAIVRLRATTSE